MAVFKCKMCGGPMEITNGTVAECVYCGTKQTLPRLDDDRRANLYDRANHFRRNNEFDKAMGIYEQILNEDNTDAEAYWSLVLCRYGIEYVEDPASHKRIPTVNRAQYTSIFDDDNYRSALSHADALQRSIYEAEAKAINEIQKGILAISQKEEPFDVFICYKESDQNGRRTPDSVLAQELYFQLTREGFKVFFARITLEDKLGSAYEPYIFAALNSAKAMVVLGTKPEYFKSAWVKNEWSRYLTLIKQGQQKMLIPAYKDMDPYDLPEEFSHLQAQDMSKLGFMQDLIHGIKKIVQVDEPKNSAGNKTVSTAISNANITPLLRRALMLLRGREQKRMNLTVVLVAVLILVIGFFALHVWTPATCTEQSVCRICGKMGMEALGHDWVDATCTEDGVCQRCDATKPALGHDWVDATCTENGVCQRCGATKPALGHDWVDATCTENGVCQRCGATEPALGHDWIAATCTQTGTCQRCGATEPALGHDWVDATCTEAGMCTRCDKTEPALGHEWTESAEWSLGVCSRCKSKKEPDPVYITDLNFTDKYGKLWTLGEKLPGYFRYRNYSVVDWEISEEAYAVENMNRPGHSLEPVYDYLGNQYTCGLHVDGSELSAYYVTYYIGGLYTKFTGYYCGTPEVADWSDWPYGKYFEICDETGRALFQSDELKYGDERKSFSVDVTGVQYLTIFYPATDSPSRMTTIFDGMLS